MKNYLQNNYSEVVTYDHLQAAVKNAWEKVGEFEFRALIGSMSSRCQAVIDAQGRFTKY